MSEMANFRICYDGPALESHEMDIKELAPALLAVGVLLEEANHVVNEGKARVSVKVKGSFQSGSFLIDFIVRQDVHNVIDFFASNPLVVSAVNLSTLLGIISGTGYGVIKLILWIKGRIIKRLAEKDNDRVILELSDGDSMEVDRVVIELYRNVKIRQSLEDVITKPLSKEGIESFQAEDKRKKGVKILKSEKDLFKAPPAEDELLAEQEKEKRLQIISISFQEGNKWRFTDGNVSFFANVTDEAFTKAVQSNEEYFAKDDILTVLLKEKQWSTLCGLKTEYEIVKVIKHQRGARQLKLPYEEK
jgi:hypothetical protein